MHRLFGVVFILVCMVCSGCKTISRSTININADSAQRSVKSLAVMRFDDRHIQEEEVKGLIMKTISNPDAGEMLADILTSELLRWGKHRVLTRPEVKNEIKGANAKEDELVKLRDYAALEKILKVDAVIIGRIHKFGLSNMTVYARGNVHYTAECIDTKNGKVLWSMDVNESAPYKDEVDLAMKVVRESVKKLREEPEN